jgi:hypothetical protein
VRNCEPIPEPGAGPSSLVRILRVDGPVGGEMGRSSAMGTASAGAFCEGDSLSLGRRK